MIEQLPSPAAAGESRVRVPVLVAVATLAEAIPLLGLKPLIIGMGCRDYVPAAPILCAGFAGACQPSLRPGDLIIIGGDELREELRAVEGRIWTVDHVASPAEKRAYGREGIAAVDMETAWLAQAAAEAGLPFLGIRVIIDRLCDRAVSAATAQHYVPAALRLRRAVRQALRLWP